MMVAAGRARYASASWFAALASALVMGAPGAHAMTPSPDTPANSTNNSTKVTPDMVLVGPGTSAAYDCATEAIGMDFTPFKKTGGTIRLTLTRNAAQASGARAPNELVGTWRVSGNVQTHVASIAKLLTQTCAQGCPFTLPFKEKEEAMLWAPAPKSLDRLGDSETLTIAVLRSDPLSVSISTFRGRDIVALEKGTCRKADQSSP